MTKSITNKLLATAAVSALLSCSPVAGAQADEPWHGFYLGDTIGWEWTDSDFSHSAPGAPAPQLRAANGSFSTDGVALGLQAGLNHQIGMLVLGVEGDITWIDDKDSVTLLPGAGIQQTFREDIDWVGTIRGRVGAAVMDNAMLYFTGGWAFGQVDHEVEFTGPGRQPVRVDDGDSGSGYALGGGGEFQLGTIMGLPMSAKVEYLYIDLGDSTVTTPAAPNFAASTTSFDNEIQQVRVGLNVQLGGM